MLNSLELGILINRWNNENVHVTGLWGVEVLEPAKIYLSDREKNSKLTSSFMCSSANKG